MRILLVDDITLFREGLVRLISGQPDLNVVGEAKSVREAVDQALLLKPDVILLDISLPDGTGFDAAGMILKELPGVKIVFLTVHEEDDRLFEAIRYGAEGYLLKNIPADELIAYVRGLEQGAPAITPGLTARILKEFAQTHVHKEAPPAVVRQLTTRQRQVLHLLRSGATNQEIAQALVLSEQTVKNYVSTLLSILQVKNRYEAAEFARRYDL
jgi:DNA-binding NarL/FixJ family response regulator